MGRADGLLIIDAQDTAVTAAVTYFATSTAATAIVVLPRWPPDRVVVLRALPRPPRLRLVGYRFSPPPGISGQASARTTPPPIVAPPPRAPWPVALRNYQGRRFSMRAESA